MTRFIIVEDALDNFVTKMANAKDKEENQSTFSRLFTILDKEYYKGTFIESRINNLREMVEDDYTKLKDMRDFENETKRKEENM